MVFFIVSLQLLKAVGVAFWYSLIRWDKPGKRFAGFFRLMWASFRAPLIDTPIEQLRNQACRGCPLFYQSLQTCGSPLDKELVDADGKPLGCWCHIPTKNKLAGATCWLHDHTAGAQGWPKELYGKTT